jgi:hypothetical protein
LIQKMVLQQRMSGPMSCSTGSSTRGSRIRSSSHLNNKKVRERCTASSLPPWRASTASSWRRRPEASAADMTGTGQT